VPSFFIPFSARPQVLPEDGAPLDRLKRDSLRFLIAIKPLTPLYPSRWNLQSREIGAAPNAVCVQVHHERAYAVSLPPSAGPVIVMRIVTGWTVTLGPHLFDVHKGSVALEGLGAAREALDGSVEVGEKCDLGVANMRFELGGVSVVNGRRGEVRGAEGMEM
jgi:hypothetical protein